jgi:hypothetical protein
VSARCGPRKHGTRHLTDAPFRRERRTTYVKDLAGSTGCMAGLTGQIPHPWPEVPALQLPILRSLAAVKPAHRPPVTREAVPAVQAWVRSPAPDRPLPIIRLCHAPRRGKVGFERHRLPDRCRRVPARTRLPLAMRAGSPFTVGQWVPPPGEHRGVVLRTDHDAACHAFSSEPASRVACFRAPARLTGEQPPWAHDSATDRQEDESRQSAAVISHSWIDHVKSRK